MKDVQQQGGPFSQQSTYVGLERQITIDTDNFRVLVHDGVTPGGHLIITRDESDARYQFKIPEFDNLAFGAAEKGMFVRRGPGVWAIRKIKGTLGQVTVADEDGFNGDPTVSLPDEITKALKFSGGIETTAPLVATGGVVGATSGNHTGPVTGAVTGNVTGNLTGDSVGTHTGAIDARGAAVFVDSDALPMGAIQGLAAALAALAVVPSGVIVDWYGDTSNVPAGWFLCDGLNGTPDLRDRFVICAGATYAAHSTGGSDSLTPAGTLSADGSHTHGVTVNGHVLSVNEIPAHFHLNGVTDKSSPSELFNRPTVAANPTTPDSIDNNPSAGIYEGTTSSTGGDQAHSHGASSTAAGTHSHLFTGTPVDFVPPYYALCKIMKG